MCIFLTRTCKGGSPPPPLQSRLPAENRPCGEAVPYSLRPWVGQDNTSLYCHALAPLTRPIPGPRPFGANASRCSKMLPAFLSLRCAPACGETARPIFLSRSKTLRADVFFNPITVGRVSAAHPPPGFRRRLQRKYARAVTSFRSPFHHPDIFWLSQNLSRLGENPSRLPPIKKVGALRLPTLQICGETARPIFFSRSKTLRADVSLNTVTVGRVSTAHPPPGFRSRVEGKYATPVTSFRSPFHHPDIFLLSQNPGRLGENPPPPIKKVGALCAPTSPKPITAGSLACVTTPRWRRRSRGGLSATARPG